VQNIIGILMGIALNMYIAFVSLTIFTVLVLLRNTNSGFIHFFQTDTQLVHYL
jgi:hypothetical protein